VEGSVGLDSNIHDRIRRQTIENDSRPNVVVVLHHPDRDSAVSMI